MAIFDINIALKLFTALKAVKEIDMAIPFFPSSLPSFFALLLLSIFFRFNTTTKTTTVFIFQMYYEVFSMLVTN